MSAVSRNEPSSDERPNDASGETTTRSDQDPARSSGVAEGRRQRLVRGVAGVRHEHQHVAVAQRVVEVVACASKVHDADAVELRTQERMRRRTRPRRGGDGDPRVGPARGGQLHGSTVTWIAPEPDSPASRRIARSTSSSPNESVHIASSGSFREAISASAFSTAA